MTHLLKKIYITSALLLMTSIGYAYADPSSLTCEETEDCCPCQTRCSGKVFLGAELLYWRAFNSGINICLPDDVSETITPGGQVISTFRGKTRNPRFEWNPGFRVGAGYESTSGHWDFAVLWTHLDSKAHSSGNHENRHRWKLNFDVIDIVAGYKSDLSSCFVLRPFGGLRGARIDQKLHAGHFFSSSSFYSAYDFNRSHKSDKEKFEGIGPLIGLEAEVSVFCNFSVYGNVSVSWLYGKFNVHLQEDTAFEDAFNACHVRKHLDATITAMDAALGIRWHKCICKNKQLIIQLGLEHHRYFNYNRLCEYGDLSFDGVNLSAGFGF